MTTLLPVQHHQHSDALIKERTLRILGGHFEQINNILTGGRSTFITVEQVGPAPGWSIGRKIYLNCAMCPPMQNMADYVVVTGVNYHELSHTWWTPSLKHIEQNGPVDMARDLRTDPHYQMVFNILEDQRIERLMVAKYGEMKNYLTAVFLQYCLNTQEQIDTAYLLTHGRRYLDRRLRRTLAKAFKCKNRRAVLLEGCRIIDEYRRLNMARSSHLIKGDDLIREFIAVLKRGGIIDDLQRQPSKCDAASGLVQERQKQTAGVPQRETMSATDTDKLDDKAAESEGEDKEAQNVPTQGAQLKPGELDGAVNNSQQNAMSSDDVQTQTRHLQDLVRDRMPTTSDVGTWHASFWQKRDVDPEWLSLGRAITTALQTAEMDVDPGWHPDADHGRVNVQRAMLADPTDRGLYNEWKEGGPEGLDLEIFFLADTSFSMNRHIKNLTKAIWVMKFGADGANVRMTAYTYSDDIRRVYGPEDFADTKHWLKLDPQVDTIPYGGLVDAHTALTGSKRKIKFFIVMTDGSWTGGAGARRYEGYFGNDGIIKDMNDKGIHTALIYLGDDVSPQGVNGHCCKDVFTIDTLDELPALIQQMMTDAMRGQ